MIITVALVLVQEKLEKEYRIKITEVAEAARNRIEDYFKKNPKAIYKQSSDSKKRVKDR